MNLIFIYSLPRSGSTLLQRLISSDEMRTAPEPWVLLGLLSMVTPSLEVNSDYSYSNLRLAVDELKSMGFDFNASVREFIKKYYNINDDSFFLDKTPRNTYVLPEILKTFPDCKHIFLVRSPVCIMNSMITTWGGVKRWRFRVHLKDFDIGLNHMLDQYNNDKYLLIKYEEMVINPVVTLNKISDYLKISVRDLSLTDLPNSTMGDKTGLKKFKTVSSESLNNNLAFCNFYRRWRMKRLLLSFDEKKLEYIGYNLEDELKLLYANTSNKYIFRDLLEELFQLFKVLLPLRRLKLHKISEFFIKGTELR